MTMLLLETKRVAREGGLFAHPVSLRSWLAGDWGLLFSHADDFAQYHIEADRWLVLIAYVLALTSTNHLMGFLAVPALGIYVLWTDWRVAVQPWAVGDMAGP